ncbi:MerR family transcriptional regulator [Liquorilactobacillus oeni]|uniref:HTH merR-type domain-containing protein n=1 Tax=Liquorilactobacillus oeni DSM 19972 TaxID=1423777 RepID=A0A0R1MAA1_9LACO|nr:MerR family transcriptional regulator [Liquorilactobacillus oeni]KRL05175.1 hypothetical protein FD46_GL001126 [Liquorilactobacillus oeni DSM 19972]
MFYSVKQVSDILQIPVTELRYYAKRGLYPTVERDRNNQRCFTEWDLNWVYLADILSKSGMSLKNIKHYIEISRQGDVSIPERYQMLSAVKDSLTQRQQLLNEQQSVINEKINRYQQVLNGQEVDKWNPQTTRKKYHDLLI